MWGWEGRAWQGRSFSLGQVEEQGRVYTLATTHQRTGSPGIKSAEKWGPALGEKQQVPALPHCSGRTRSLSTGPLCHEQQQNGASAPRIWELEHIPMAPDPLSFLCPAERLATLTNTCRPHG